MKASPSRVVLFDSECLLCHASLRFIVRRDPHGEFAFAPLNSEAAGRIVGALPEPFANTGDLAARSRRATAQSVPDSVILVEDGRVFVESTAALRIARRLAWPWPLLSIFMIVPPPLRDVVYRFIARRRYRWFGRDECLVPTPDIRARIIG